MTREHADLPRRSGHDDHLRVALEGRTFGRDHGDGELRVLGHRYAADAAGSRICSPRATACSIVPAM